MDHSFYSLFTRPYYNVRSTQVNAKGVKDMNSSLKSFIAGWGAVIVPHVTVQVSKFIHQRERERENSIS